jgi:transcriptional regulator with XRE-family HTH domain
MSRKAPDPTDLHVGRRLRMRRMMLGMSQTKLGEAVGVTFQQLQKYENGSNRISASRLTQIANALKVAPTFFFEDPLRKAKTDFDGAPPTATITNFLATSDGLSLARSFSRLRNAKLRRAIVALVEDVAKN